MATATKNNAAAALNGQYSPTDLDLNWNPNGSTTCTSAAGVDLCMYDFNYGSTGWVGRTDCIGTVTGANPAAECSKHRVRLNEFNSPPNYPTGAGTSTYNICHEVGHAVGLRHRFVSMQGGGPQTCLRTLGEITGAGGNWTSYTFLAADETSDINAHYK